MYWLRWHYHVKDIAGAPYKIKQNKTKRTVRDWTASLWYIAGCREESVSLLCRCITHLKSLDQTTYARLEDTFTWPMCLTNKAMSLSLSRFIARSHCTLLFHLLSILTHLPTVQHFYWTTCAFLCNSADVKFSPRNLIILLVIIIMVIYFPWV